MFEVERRIRQNILDGLRIEGTDWSGTLDDVDFLSRIFDLGALPSFDSRYKTASADIWQHRINNYDWEDDWVYGDPRIALLDGPVEKFLSFLCEILHPVVRADSDEARRLALQFNDQLKQAQIELVEVERIAGRPKFEPQLISDSSSLPLKGAKSVAEVLSSGWMRRETERMEEAIETDPALAIGTAKDLIESCCKTILGRLGVEVPKKADIPKLTKLLAKELSLVPEGISDEARGADNIRRTLQNLSSITGNIAELRSLYGSGHGRDGQHRGLEPRHARLAVTSAIGFVEFATATYQKQQALKE